MIAHARPSCGRGTRFPRLEARHRRQGEILDANSFYLLFIPGFTILAFLIGALLATIAMSAKVELPTEDEVSDGQPAH